MDLPRFRSLLTAQQRASIDLEATWLRYRAGGGLDEDDAFEAWLAGQYPDLFAAEPPPADTPVQMSRVLPARFACEGDPAQTRVDADAPTLFAGDSASQPDAPSAVAAGVFHYEMLGTAGKGGMGTVHIARDTELLRRVALKQLKPEADVVAGARTRFLREVQITAQLDHPNIVPVYALEVVPGGTPAYTMKLVQGMTFHALLNDTRDALAAGREPDEAHSLAARLEHFLKVCDAMAYAHDKGVIHRDLKPANLMIGRHNEVYVMDWGLCRILQVDDDDEPENSVVMTSPDASGSASQTRFGDIVGTPKYMSPEQARGHNQVLDARSDQCALGLILYEIVTLRAPYDGHTAREVLANAATGKRRPISHRQAGGRIPRELAAIIERATAFAADDRYASVAALAADLRRYLRGEAVLARPDTPWQRAQRWITQHRQAALNILLGTVAAASVAIGGLLWLNQRQAQSERVREQRILALSSAVSAIGDQVQMRFLQVEGGLVNLADSVAQILVHGRNTNQRVYLRSDFVDPKRAPPDLIPSAVQHGRVSLGWPVWLIPAGLPRKDALAQVDKLAALQDFMRDIFARSAHMIAASNTDFYAGRQTTLSGDRNALASILVALDNGITGRYPGWDEMPADFDPRVRPWYSVARGKHGPQWGDPYASIADGPIELPLSVPLYDDHSKFIGVVSAQFLPDEMVKSLFSVPRGRAIQAMYLLDAKGHILAASGNKFPLQHPGSDDAIHQVFPLPELLTRVKAGQSGVLQTLLRGIPAVVAFDSIAPFGWSVVAVVDPQRLFAAKSTVGPAE